MATRRLSKNAGHIEPLSAAYLIQGPLRRWVPQRQGTEAAQHYGDGVTSLTDPRLSGLGRNPAAPEDVLLRLAAHPAGRHGIAGRPGQLSDNLVEALLAHGDARTAVHLHGNRISPAMRRRIAEHPDPQIRDAYPAFIRHTVKRHVSVGIRELEEAYAKPRARLADAPDPALRAAVARVWHDRPHTVQLRFLADPDPQVRSAATEGEHPGVPPDWWDRCLADPATRFNVAWYLPLTDRQFSDLLRADDQDLTLAVASNPHLTADMVTQLVDHDDPDVQVAPAASRHVDADTRARLYAATEAAAATGSISAQMSLSLTTINPDWLRAEPLDERLRYLDCPHAVFRRVLATCPDLPTHAWQRLDNDPDLSVRRAAARRPTTPSDVLEHLVRTHGDLPHIRPLHVEHPNFPRHALHTFIHEPNPHVRYLALHDPDLPESALHNLTTAAEPFIRAGVATHLNTSQALLAHLLDDPDPDVVDNAAAHPTLPTSLMRQILTTANL